MAITIKDIAKRANVSTATVSRVINGIGGYGSDTRNRVLAAAQELGYYKNETATSLVTNKTKTIGIIIPNVSTSFYGNIVTGIEDVAYDFGYSVILTHAGVEGNRLFDSLKLMVNRRVDGIIIVSIYLNKEQQQMIRKLGVPTILLSTISEGNRLPYIKVDDYAASYHATQYLVNQGHQKIGLAGVNQNDQVAGQPRLAGYRDCLEKNQILRDEALIFFGDFSFDAGKRAMDYYMTHELPTALVCASDDTALGIISMAHQYKILVPEQLSVIGYDDTSVAWMTTPPLTTIAQPFYEMGALGCKRLIESVTTNQEIRSEIIPFELMERQTVLQRSNNPKS
ncbi:LacI family DNA-binding transcriptional regulator [Vagococcus entomophilus]|uniref:LacI family transcriptional regulator n=1 Tax=Vagococcus entomophilus TaxID=1160095 RepID=A0A430AGQ9_9ENTE|nr:LacI family DNA-binding transcriptional regulator [Vagococcus entomophilus]RSU07102.1 LacI family transcriptional regulator [Vagococcus entomophilus]